MTSKSSISLLNSVFITPCEMQLHRRYLDYWKPTTGIKRLVSGPAMHAERWFTDNTPVGAGTRLSP